MRMAGLSHTVWYSLNMLTNIATFIACRFISIAWMMRWFWHNAEDIDQPYYGVLATSLPVMYIINIILFFKIMSKDAKHILSIVKNFKSGIHNSWRKYQSHDHPPTCINSKMLRRD
uniref:TLC domain-containing protein 2-like n=1 Tax=Styela clava TaxID=7725 RepID=UPI00193AA6AE|nr:TLC domain-containing protein 2-like [Styela clava]